MDRKKAEDVVSHIFAKAKEILLAHKRHAMAVFFCTPKGIGIADIASIAKNLKQASPELKNDQKGLETEIQKMLKEKAQEEKAYAVLTVSEIWTLPASQDLTTEQKKREALCLSWKFNLEDGEIWKSAKVAFFDRTNSEVKLLEEENWIVEEDLHKDLI